MPRLGQHFLQSGAALKKIATVLALAPNETTVEIGPGHGELTACLIERIKKLGLRDARIIAIEKDAGLMGGLKKRFADETRVEIIHGDALKLIPALLKTNPMRSRPYKLAGNLPFYLTGRLLRIIGELEPKPTRSVFTLQKEVALRLAAKPPRMNRLAASVQFWAEPTIVESIPRDAFRPAPAVDALIVKLETKPAPTGSERYYETVRLLFAHPRKTILNNLGTTVNRTELPAKLKEAGIRAEDRPQNLAIEDVIKISEIIGASC